MTKIQELAALADGTLRIARRVRSNHAPSGDILALVEHAEKCAAELDSVITEITREGE